MKPPGERTVVICSYLEPDAVRRLQEDAATARVLYHPELLPVPRYRCDHSGVHRDLPKSELARWESILARADIAFDFDWLAPATMHEQCPTLQWIQATSAGIGGFMQRTGLDRSGISVTTAAGIHAVPLAEFALTGILHFKKGIPELDAWKRRRHWQRFTTEQLSGTRALVVGLGGVGRKVAAILSPLGVEVWGMGRSDRSYELPGVAQVITRAELDGVLPQVDALILACPLTAETKGLIGRTQIDLLQQHAIVVNVSRGQVVDQDALTEALRAHRIRGACLDVFSEEPLPMDDPMWDLDNVIVSPHSASTVATENAALVDLFIDNLRRMDRGEPMRNLYDPVAGY